MPPVGDPSPVGDLQESKQASLGSFFSGMNSVSSGSDSGNHTQKEPRVSGE